MTKANTLNVFFKNNYNADFIKRNIYRPTETDETNRNPTPVTTVTIPYIKCTSETISYIHTYIHDLFDKAGYRSIGKTSSPDVDLYYLI